jgi:hypothetical protein
VVHLELRLHLLAVEDHCNKLMSQIVPGEPKDQRPLEAFRGIRVSSEAVLEFG